MTRNSFDDNQFLWAVSQNAQLNAWEEEGVRSGCTPSKGSGFDVDIASGTIVAGGPDIVSVSAQTVTLTDPANDSDMNSGESRIDLISIDANGSAGVTEGAAASDPTSPDIPSSEVLVAAVLVANSDNSISDSTLYDYRVTGVDSSAIEVIDESTAFDGSEATISIGKTQVKNGSIELVGQTIDDFESGDLVVEGGGWNDWTDSGPFSAQQTTVINGSWSGELTSSSGSRETATLNASENKTADFETKLRLSGIDGGTSTNYKLFIRDSGNNLVELIFDNQNNVDINGNTDQTTWSQNTNYTYRFEFDFDNDQVEVFRDNSSVGTFALLNSASHYDEYEIQAIESGSDDTLKFFVDDVNEVDATSGTATISWSSPVDIISWDLAAYQQTLNNETVTVDIEDSGGSNLKSDIGENTDISDLSTSDNIQFFVTLSRNDTSNNPKLDYVARRYYR